MLRMMKAHSALDADESDAIDAAEMKNSVSVLLKLDENGDGTLISEEVGMKRMGPQDTGAAYSSAIAIEFGGKRQYVQFLAKTVAGVSAEDGKLLWRYDKPANGMRLNISTPIFKDGHIFAASAYGAGGGLAKLIKNPDGGFAAEEVWFSKSMENHHGGIIIHDGAVYGSNGGNGGGYLACLDLKTGDVLWNERDSDKRRVSKGSVAFVDGRIYYRTEEGTMLLIEPSRTEYIERGRFEQPDRTRLPAWAHPAVANGKLYVRDQDTLYCYDVKEGNQSFR
jgi:outer membrane protein assembly factor BamB